MMESCRKPPVTQFDLDRAALMFRRIYLPLGRPRTQQEVDEATQEGIRLFGSEMVNWAVNIWDRGGEQKLTPTPPQAGR